MTSTTLLQPGARPDIGLLKYLSHQTLVDFADWISEQQDYLNEWYEEVAGLPDLDGFTINLIRKDISMDLKLLLELERIVDEMFEEKKPDEEICEGDTQCQE